MAARAATITLSAIAGCLVWFQRKPTTCISAPMPVSLAALAPDAPRSHQRGSR